MSDKKPFKLTYRTDKLARLYGKYRGELGDFALGIPSVAVETGHYVNKTVGFGQVWLFSKTLTIFRNSPNGLSLQEYIKTWHSATTFPEMLGRLGFELEDPIISYDFGTEDLIYFTGSTVKNPYRLVIDGLELSQHYVHFQELVLFLLEICWRRHLSKPLYSTMTVKILNNTNNPYFTDELLRPLVRLLPDVELILETQDVSTKSH